MTSGKKHILFFLFITILVLSVSCVTNQKNDQVAIVLEAEQKKSITIEESIDVENAYLQSPPEQISLQNEDASNGLTNTEGLSHDNGIESNEELNPNEEKIIIDSIQAPQEYSVVPTHSDLSVSSEDTEAGVELENNSVISDVKFTDSSKDLDSVSSGDAAQANHQIAIKTDVSDSADSITQEIPSDSANNMFSIISPAFSSPASAKSLFDEKKEDHESSVKNSSDLITQEKENVSNIQIDSQLVQNQQTPVSSTVDRSQKSNDEDDTSIAAESNQVFNSPKNIVITTDSHPEIIQKETASEKKVEKTIVSRPSQQPYTVIAILIIITLILAIIIFAIKNVKKRKALCKENALQQFDELPLDPVVGQISFSCPFQSTEESSSLDVLSVFDFHDNCLSGSVQYRQRPEDDFEIPKQALDLDNGDEDLVYSIASIIRNVEDRIVAKYTCDQVYSLFPSIRWKYQVINDLVPIPIIKKAFILKGFINDNVQFHLSYEEISKKLDSYDFSMCEFKGDKLDG